MKPNERIYRMAYIYVKNQNDALDVVQETAYRSFKSIESLKEPKYFKTWLMRIAISCSLDILRKRKNVVQLNPEFEEYISGQVNEDIIAEITLKDLINQLEANEKSVILLRFYQGLNLQEVSETLKIPLGTAKTIFLQRFKQAKGKFEGR